MAARLMLDTTILVDAERGLGPVAHGLGRDDDVAVAALTVAELKVGIELASAAKRSRREAFLERVLETIEVEDYDRAVAIEHGLLLAHAQRTGRPRGRHDLILAATAKATGRVLVTTDRSGFTDLPGVVVQVPGGAG